MTEQELQRIFESEFNWDNWKKVMNFVFPEFKFNLMQTDLARDTKAKEEKAGYIKVHGQSELASNETLMLCEVLVKDKIRLDRNVKSVRSLVAGEVIPNYQTVIAVFHNADNTKWRFTLVVKEFTGNHKTYDKKPDSYTYVFGKGEKGRTAADRFIKLAEKPTKTLKDLEEAFSVEALSKKFFKEYKVIYQLFVNDIKDSRSKLALFPDSTKEKQEKNARDFVKKMMGRIIFLYFLQKKGWLGCKTKWKDGDEQFMQTFVDKAKQDDNFYHRYLEPLFFDTLNEKRTKQDEDCIIQKTPFGKVPFLNGGLFEKDENHPNALTLKWDIFAELFETLNSYNFTIIEDDPEFKEVAVDPEMLGHVFEDLLEERKEKGTFYTPKEIVHYMCQESLLEYLKTYLKQNGHWPNEKSKIEQIENGLLRFVKQKLYADVSNYDKIIAKALKEVKICDPAIGSGAFPMGLLNEIYLCIHKLHDENPDGVGKVWSIGKHWQGNKVKQSIIQNSIYGVDIEKGAVDIARLRFWLSLIIDEPEPTALPNLDYKIVVGNSLVSKLGDDVVDIDWDTNETAHGLFGANLTQEKGKLLKRISEAQKESFNPESDKKKLAKDVRNLKIELLINQLNLMITNKGIHQKPTGSGKSVTKQTETYLQTLGWKENIAKLEKLKKNSSLPLHFFDWKLDFPEVLNPLLKENGGLKETGFDIVIGNPPYGISLKEKERNYLIVNLSKVPDYEIYYWFINKAHQLLKSGGVTSLIIPNTILFNVHAQAYRRSLFDRWQLNEVLDCTNFNIFESATVRNVILLFTKDNSKQNFLSYKSTSNNNSFKELSNRKKISISKSIAENNIQNWGLIFKLNQGVLTVIEKIKNNKVRLVDLFPETSQGLIAYDKYQGQSAEIIKNRAYHHFSNPKNKYKFWLYGEDITRYSVKWNGKEYIDYCEGIANPRASKFFNGKRLLVREITNPRIFTALTTEELYNDPAIIIIKENLASYPLECLLAVFNSKLATFYHFNSSPKATKGSFPKILVYDVNHFPLPRSIDKKSQEKIEVLVEKIISLKEEGKDSNKQERQIDQLVYQLYNLSEEEIKIIEGII